ncbi:MAG TPA: tryptophan synthase subunit alpha [Campylobacteraceae bacterium]|nr:tryptophan synthase subunit alpha [Campylobacteraceae bacterium]
MKKLVAYITTGYPDLDFTEDAAMALKEAGVDTLELGVPFSDPVADGPVIEEANLKALQNGFKIQHLLDLSQKIASDIDTLWMGYFNPFYHRGIEKITDEAAERGISGFIIPDLPFEEALPYKETFRAKNLALIDFVAPTDSAERIAKVVADAQKFIYLVAYAGITGSGQSEDLGRVIANIREATDTDLYIGFGVNAQTARKKAKGVDGVIVGSAFVSLMLDKELSYTDKIIRMQDLARTIKEEINS